jgi:hypothetical protein
MFNVLRMSRDGETNRSWKAEYHNPVVGSIRKLDVGPARYGLFDAGSGPSLAPIEVGTSANHGVTISWRPHTGQEAGVGVVERQGAAEVSGAASAQDRLAASAVRACSSLRDCPPA